MISAENFVSPTSLFSLGRRPTNENPNRSIKSDDISANPLGITE